MATLKSGLEKIISLVEALPPTGFMMDAYANCVIGKTVGWEGSQPEYNPQVGWKTINKLFGLNKPISTEYGALGEDSKKYYTDEEWSVIRLFTNNVGNGNGNVTRSVWLKLARTQLRKMQ